MAAGSRIGQPTLVLWLCVPLVTILLGTAQQAAGQFGATTRYELSEVVDVNEIDNAARTHLAHLDQYTRAEQWDEALDTLRLLLETYDDKLIEIEDRRFISVREFCHQRLCALPADALAQWRLSADPQAKQWYERGAEQRDPLPLLEVIERSFASSYGDDALYLLAELALERGQHTTARRYWRMMLPATQRISIDSANDSSATLLEFPHTSYAAADINARLVLTSILEGNLDRAQRELQAYGEMFGDASGQLGGRTGKLNDLLSDLLESARLWPNEPAAADWQTFAGSASRAQIAATPIDPGAKQWEVSLPEVSFNELLAYGAGAVRRVASPHPLQRERQRLLSYHPIVVDQTLLINTSEEIQAFDLQTGRPAWQRAAIFRDALPPSTQTRRGFRSGGPGVPRYSMTAHNHRLYARMGPPLTMTVDQPPGLERRGYLVCLDLKAQGRLLWKVYPDHDKLAFEGSPVADGANIYVAMRRSDVRPKALVACYDAETGRRRWLREVCSAETIGRGQYEETTSNLLTLHEGALFLNSNLGAVARLNARDGHIEWLKVYRQRQEGDLNRLQAYLHRDLTPCVYSDERVFVAPADDERIYALNAETGEALWSTRYAADAVHLLGVAAGKLVASGDRIYWIDIETGKLVHFWPDGPAPRGYGRGLLAGNLVYWPTRDEIRVFDQSTAELRKKIDLRYRDEAASGGNLLIADGNLVVAASNRLLVFGQRSRIGDQQRLRAARASDAIPDTSSQQ